MRIRNADGGEVEACGNGTRCVADLLMKENGSRPCRDRDRGGAARCRGRRRRADQRRYGAGAPRLARDPAGQGHGHAASRRGAGRAQGSGRRSISAIPMRCSSSTMPRRSIWRRSARCWSAIRCFPSAPISRSRRSSRPRTHPHAGLGARRRHHARLRHRRLRHPGRGRAAQAHRPARPRSCSTAAASRSNGWPTIIVRMTGPVAVSFAGELPLAQRRPGP